MKSFIQGFVSGFNPMNWPGMVKGLFKKPQEQEDIVVMPTIADGIADISYPDFSDLDLGDHGHCEECDDCLPNGMLAGLCETCANADEDEDDEDDEDEPYENYN